MYEFTRSNVCTYIARKKRVLDLVEPPPFEAQGAHPGTPYPHYPTTHQVSTKNT